MSMLNRVRLLSVQCCMCKNFILKSLNAGTVHCFYRWKSTGVGLLSNPAVVITNLCEKFKCTENEAKHIYDQHPTLRSIDTIQKDSLEFLRTKLSLTSIIENPELITMNYGKNDFFNGDVHRIRINFLNLSIVIIIVLFRYIEPKIYITTRDEPETVGRFCTTFADKRARPHKYCL